MLYFSIDKAKLLTDLMNIVDLSEKYRKYLIQYIWNDISYYSIAGADLENDEQDKVLTDVNQNLVLAKTVDDLIQFIERSNVGFDQVNLNRWLEHVKSVNNVDPYAIFSIDCLAVRDSKAVIEELDEIASIVGMIIDYAIQTDNTYLDDLLHKDEIGRLLDDSMDVEIWKVKSINEIAEIPNVDVALAQVHEEYIKHIAVI